MTVERGDLTFHIELPGEASYGIKGVELRSADPRCPFKMTVQCDRDGTARDYTVEIMYPVWEGRPVTELPLFEQTLQLAHCMAEGCKFRFDFIDYGVHKTLLTGETDKAGPDFEDTFNFLKIVDKLRFICGKLGAAVVFRQGIEVTVQEQRDIHLAYDLLNGKTAALEGAQFTVTPSEEGREALLEPGTMGIQLQMSLNVSFAGSPVTTVPVKADIVAFKVSSQDEDTIIIDTLAGTTISWAAQLKENS
jgi:hypothetical protein